MNDDQLARRLCRLLDSAADELPPGIQSRLAAARLRALDRLDTRHATRPATGSRARDWLAGWLPRSGWARLAVTAVPAVLLMLAALAGSLFNQEQTVIQQADAYTEMLTADVPLNAYVDNGFAAHLHSNRLQVSLPAAHR